MSNVSIRGLDKAAVLAALYNAARAQGKGFMHYDPKPMTADEARTILAQTTDFNYLKGRVMKLDLSKDDFMPDLYDRDNGLGTAQKVIDTLKASGDTNNKVIAATHNENTTVQAMQTRAGLGDETRFETKGGMVRATLGLADMAKHLGPKVDKVLKKG